SILYAAQLGSIKDAPTATHERQKRSSHVLLSQCGDQDSLNSVQPILGLIEDDRCFRLEYFLRDLQGLQTILFVDLLPEPGVCIVKSRQTVHKFRVWVLCQCH